MKHTNHQSEKSRGQIIPLFVIFLPVVIALVALILDGGMTMVNRRQAQAAADAGALAGAKELCKHSTNATVISTAINYATVRNTASTASATIVNGQVDVNAHVVTDSFFSRVFGQNKLDAQAEASAGCFQPASGYTLPVAWSCKAPIGGSDSTDCQLFMLDWATEMKPLIDLNNGGTTPVAIHDYGTVNAPWKFDKNYLTKYLYIIVDSNKIPVDINPCLSAGGSINCDINGDGIDDIITGGNKSWLDLNGGGGGASQLKNWVNGIGVPEITIHSWLGGQQGNDTTVYKAVEGLTNPLVLIPVFNGYCTQNPDAMPICELTLHDPIPPEEKVIAVGGNSAYFHIIGISAFYVTCVDDGGAEKCPGGKAFVAANPALKNSVKTIEGYFVSNPPIDSGGSGTGGVDVGVHIISLTK